MRADKPRREAGVRDMMISLGVIFAFIALGWAAFIPRTGATVRVIDFHAPLTAAQAATPFPLLAPEGLSDRWRPTSAYAATSPGVSFHIGFVTPADQYAAVEQSNAPAATEIDSVLGKDSVTGETATLGSRVWTLRTTRSRGRALVRSENGVTVIVTGTAEWAELQQLALALR